MKITKDQLKQLIREAIEEEMSSCNEDFAPGMYQAPHEITEKHANQILNQLGPSASKNQKVRMIVINGMDTAVSDAIDFANEQHGKDQQQLPH